MPKNKIKKPKVDQQVQVTGQGPGHSVVMSSSFVIIPSPELDITFEIPRVNPYPGRGKSLSCFSGTRYSNGRKLRII